MKKNKKIIKRIGCLFGAFIVALVSICSIIPNNKQNLNYASADEVNLSYSSNWLPVTVIASSSSSGSYVTFNSGSIKINLLNMGSSLSFNLEYQNSFMASGNYNPHIGPAIVPSLTSDNVNVNYYNMSLSGSPFYLKMAYRYYGGTVSDITRVRIISYEDSTWVGYYAGENRVITFGFLVNSRPAVYYNDFNLPIVTSADANYSLGYSQGFTAGETTGYSTGYDAGKTEGQSIGYTTGYGAGKAYGLALGSDYTFMSFFSAIFDAPIQALTGLLNFEILGVNLFNFVTALFTLGLILALVKFIL